MTQFATAAEFAARFGITLTDDEETRADGLLAMASGLIQDEVKQTIALVEDDVLTMPGTSDDRITLPERPVVSIASVELAGTPLVEDSDWYLDHGTIIGTIVDDAWPSSGGFGVPTQTLQITYTHGYDDDEIPGIVKGVCLEVVVRVWVNPGAVARETVGDTATVYDNMRFSPSGLLLTNDESRKLRRFFGDRMRSIAMGS